MDLVDTRIAHDDWLTRAANDDVAAPLTYPERESEFSEFLDARHEREIEMMRGAW